MIIDMNILEEPKEFKDSGNYLQKTYNSSNEQIISISKLYYNRLKWISNIFL